MIKKKNKSSRLCCTVRVCNRAEQKADGFGFNYNCLLKKKSCAIKTLQPKWLLQRGGWETQAAEGKGKPSLRNLCSSTAVAGLWRCSLTQHSLIGLLSLKHQWRREIWSYRKLKHCDWTVSPASERIACLWMWDLLNTTTLPMCSLLAPWALSLAS